MTEYELFCQQQHARHLMDVVNKQNTEKLEQRIKELESALDVALEALENSRGLAPVDEQWVNGRREAAINLLKEVRRD